MLLWICQAETAWILLPKLLDCVNETGMFGSSHSGAGTSGGELEEESWQPPDQELTQKLVAQIEYYLSDENLEHDAFLLKHVRRNKLGFVSVKLLTSFKKVSLPFPALCIPDDLGSSLGCCWGLMSLSGCF